MMTDLEPDTHIVNVAQAMCTLDYAEMVALAAMYERFVLTEEGVTPENRTRLVQLCADYERIAKHVGANWIAPDRGGSADAIQFIARRELEETKRRSAVS